MSIKLSDEKKHFYIQYIALLASVINDTDLPVLDEDFDWRRLCRIAQHNSVANIIACCIDKVNVKPDDEVRQVLENEMMYQILKETSQLVEAEKILKIFEENKVKNVPLKGYFMKRYYPRGDFRSMTDIDILVEKKDFPKVKGAFEKEKLESLNLFKRSEIHFRKDLMYFEIHSDLNEGDDRSYDDIWDKVRLREGYEYSYRMSNEDFYVYMLYHTAKHFLHGGIGIRMVLDVYVYIKAFEDLDFDYIEAECGKRSMKEFEKQLRKLALNWFSDDETEINSLGEFVLYCSTFGKREITFFQDGVKNERFYWLKQVFPPYKMMRERFDYVAKYPFLLPFSWIHFWFSRLFVHRDIRFKEGFRSRAERNKTDDAEFILGLMDELELNNEM